MRVLLVDNHDSYTHNLGQRRVCRAGDELETSPRGVCSGATGWSGFGGTADLNLVIRTAVVHGGRLEVGAGGAIALDSDPADEYEEMLLKARAPLRPLRPLRPDELSGP